MSLFEFFLILFILTAVSAVISSAEIALASSRKLRLQQMGSNGDLRALMVLQLQEQPGRFITVVQIGLNMVAVAAGVVGEANLSIYIKDLLHKYFPQAPWIDNAATWISFIGVTSAFILFADLMPKRLAMVYPEAIAVRTVRIMNFLIFILKPIVWIFDFIANQIFKLFKLPSVRQENMTSQDIVAFVDAGAQAGVVMAQEQYLIENIFEMQERRVTSTMTTRESIVYCDRTDNRDAILALVAEHPHTKLLVCDNGLDKILGYVESHNLLRMYLQNPEQPIAISDPQLLRKALFIPDTLSLYEVLELFKSSGEDFAVIVNEYALVVGMVTLKDVMSIVMGELVSTEEEQIVQRDADSWLIDGATPCEDVLRVLDLTAFPEEENYETIGGFMMYMLRKIPKKTDFVLYDNYKFEIIDTENFKIDQLLVSRCKDMPVVNEED